ncbi:MAG: cation-translocating P-type ATPase [Bacteroidales bacterium]
MSEKQNNQINLTVEGMSCTNCALGIRKSLESEGFENVYADFTTDSVSFNQADAQRIDLAMKRIEALGYHVKESSGEHEEAPKGMSMIEKKFWFTAIFTIPLVLAMFLPIPLLHNSYFQLALTIPVFSVGFWHFGRSAWSSIRVGVTNMDVLIFLGSTAAFVYSLVGTIYGMGHDYMFYETSASIISIVLLGNMMEHRSVKKTTSSIDELMRLQKNVAKRIVSTNGQATETIEEVDSAQVQLGENVLVSTGDKVPVDGEIYWGSCSVDEGMVSGESLPVEKKIGDQVIAGTILVSGSIKAKATAVGQQTVLSKIIAMVRNAQKDKPQLQNLADKISAIFVPIVVSLSVLTFLGWYFALGLNFQDSLLRAIAVMVIACPCALGLAIPTAVVVGLGRTAKNGILIKGGSTFDKMAAIDIIVFDKTGTLTTGKFRIKEFQYFELPKERIASILYSMEKHSSHPIAESITGYFKDSQMMELNHVDEEKGLGLEATDADGNVYRLGSYAVASHLTDDDRHNVYLLMNDQLVAWLDIEDEIKMEAKTTIDYLKKQDIRTVLLSGDRQARCEEIAATLGIAEVYAEQLPHQKLEVIERLSEEGKVGMVGDGINDAPALARAFVGISMSDATQVAVKSADVVLLKGNLELLSRAHKLTKVTLSTIKQNLFWAFIYNVAAIPLAMAGFLTPIIAAAAMAGSDIVVVLNSLRLKRRKLK